MWWSRFFWLELVWIVLWFPFCSPLKFSESGISLKPRETKYFKFSDGEKVTFFLEAATDDVFYGLTLAIDGLLLRTSIITTDSKDQIVDSEIFELSSPSPVECFSVIGGALEAPTSPIPTTNPSTNTSDTSLLAVSSLLKKAVAWEESSFLPALCSLKPRHLRRRVIASSESPLRHRITVTLESPPSLSAIVSASLLTSTEDQWRDKTAQRIEYLYSTDSVYAPSSKSDPKKTSSIEVTVSNLMAHVSWQCPLFASGKVCETDCEYLVYYASVKQLDGDVLNAFSSVLKVQQNGHLLTPDTDFISDMSADFDLNPGAYIVNVLSRVKKSKSDKLLDGRTSSVSLLGDVNLYAVHSPVRFTLKESTQSQFLIATSGLAVVGGCLLIVYLINRYRRSSRGYSIQENAMRPMPVV